MYIKKLLEIAKINKRKIFALSNYLQNRFPIIIDNIIDKIAIISGTCNNLTKNINRNFKIGFAVLINSNDKTLDICLNSLFETNTYDYNITFLLLYSNDGIKTKINKIIENYHNTNYKIVINNIENGFDGVIKKLLTYEDFDIIGWSNSDILVHPEWLAHTIKICIWGKSNHKDHILAGFSPFNSGNLKLYRIMNTYTSPFGKYVIRDWIGTVNCFYFKDDLLKLKSFLSCCNNKNSIKTNFRCLRIRHFSTEISYMNYIGEMPQDNKRNSLVQQSIYAMNIAQSNWKIDMEKVCPYSFYKYLNVNQGIVYDKNIKSDLKLDILIPVIEKDMPVLPMVVDSIRKNLCHPIGNIIIISPNKKIFTDFCNQYNCIHRDENSILPITIKDINYCFKKINRSGWVFQQLLKLSGDYISDKDHFLVLDGDTILVQPQKFEHNGKFIFLISDEYHFPYFETYKKIFKEASMSSVSFVSHQMIFDCNKLKELRNDIENLNNKSWYKVIIDNLNPDESSSFSEYETYGNWMLKKYPDSFKKEYFFNLTLPRYKLKEFQVSIEKYSHKYRSVSFQFNYIPDFL
jgi:hypothetical protein